LALKWDKVHAIAEELEHVSSLELIHRLDIFLNHPQTDPHGDPIPDVNGKIAVIRQVSIADVPEKKNVVVSSVGNQSPEMLELLKHYGIGIGTSLKVNMRLSFDGSVEIKVLKQAPCIISEQVLKIFLCTMIKYSNTDTSLSEVHQSIDTTNQKRGWRRIFFLPWPCLPNKCWLYGSGQLGYGSGRRQQIWIQFNMGAFNE
jgi:hypothetical protein